MIRSLVESVTDSLPALEKDVNISFFPSKFQLVYPAKDKGIASSLAALPPDREP